MYDAWGKLLEIDGSLKDTIGKINPYRYRGYRYDEEIAMYYLNGRFYDANIGRFINSDGLLGSQGNITGHNMYAYTLNNPVMNVDPSGYFTLFSIDVEEWLNDIVEDVKNLSNIISTFLEEEFWEVVGAITVGMAFVKKIPGGAFILRETLPLIIAGAVIVAGIQIGVTVGVYYAIKTTQYVIDYFDGFNGNIGYTNERR